MRPSWTSPRSTALSTWTLLLYARVPLAFIASSHCLALSSPAVIRSPVTNDWNDALVGAQPILPFHSGVVSWKMLVGGLGTCDALYASTRARPDRPTHVPSVARYF